MVKVLQLDDICRQALEHEAAVFHLVADADRALGTENSLEVEVLGEGALLNGALVLLLDRPLAPDYLVEQGWLVSIRLLDVVLVAEDGVFFVYLLHFGHQLRLHAFLDLLKQAQVVELVGQLAVRLAELLVHQGRQSNYLGLWLIH